MWWRARREEFGLVAPASDVDQALAAQRACAAVQALALPHWL